MFNFISGIQTVSDPHLPQKIPRVELSSKVIVSDKFRQKCNAKYLDFFGEELYFVRINNKIIAHPKNIEILRMQFLKRYTS